MVVKGEDLSAPTISSALPPWSKCCLRSWRTNKHKKRTRASVFRVRPSFFSTVTFLHSRLFFAGSSLFSAFFQKSKFFSRFLCKKPRRPKNTLWRFFLKCRFLIRRRWRRIVTQNYSKATKSRLSSELAQYIWNTRYPGGRRREQKWRHFF